MMRHTGGLARGANSTRSRSSCRAMARASGNGRIPSCWPSGSTRRTSRARMRSLILVSLAVMGVAMRHHSRRCGTPGLPGAFGGSVAAALVVPSRTPRDPTHRVPVAGGGTPDGATPLSLLAQSSTLPGVSSLWTPEGEHRVGAAEDDRSAPDAPGATSGRAGPGAPDAPDATSARDGDFDDLGPEEQA